MLQKQRLKNLDGFSNVHKRKHKDNIEMSFDDNNSNHTNGTDARKVLIATDVASRGLDIPKVDLVIHYQLPRTADIYVHRSGRTARAQREGKTVLLIDPQEKSVYKKILLHLGRKLSNNSENQELQVEDIPDCDIDISSFSAIRNQMNLARKMDQLLHQLKKMTVGDKWLNQTAKNADIEIDDQM